jgi:hypothetical protein
LQQQELPLWGRQKGIKAFVGDRAWDGTPTDRGFHGWRWSAPAHVSKCLCNRGHLGVIDVPVGSGNRKSGIKHDLLSRVEGAPIDP